jgi:hypothetical protein
LVEGCQGFAASHQIFDDKTAGGGITFAVSDAHLLPVSDI